ncbi:MAG: acyltransferase family protein [Thiobacillus sp.]|nr:acyltransferase family protein [Thiobacillus sp.]
MKRLVHVDTMKALGIVLVVVGHAPGLDATLKHVIYSFHMPLFFFISGLLLSENKLFMPTRAYVASLWRGLGTPYVFFFIVSYIYWLPTHELAASAEKYAGMSWWEPLLGVVIGNGDALYVNVVLWFFTCLISTSLLFYWLRKHFSATFLLVALNLLGLVFALGYDRSWPRLPWGLDNAVVALAFYASGHFFRRYHEAMRERTAPSRAWAFVLLLLAGVVAVARVNGEVDLNTLLFGRYPALFLVGGYLGIMALFYLSISLPALPIFQWLSRNTLIIFPTHLLMFSVFTGILVLVFGLPRDFKEVSAVWTVAFPALALALSYPVAVFAQRLFPIVFGARRTGIALQEKNA